MSQENNYHYRGTCQKCGSLFSSQSKRTKYCSMACGAAHRKKELIPCLHCGTGFKRHSIKKYCSRKCSGLAHTGPVKAERNQTFYDAVCGLCQKPYKTLKRTGSKFCSRSCTHANRRSENIPLPLWQEAVAACAIRGSIVAYLVEKGVGEDKTVRRLIKRQALSLPSKPRAASKRGDITRDIAELRHAGCLVCGEKRRVDLAHIVPHAWGGNICMANIMPLCPLHHQLYDNTLLSESEVFNLKEALLVKRQIEGVGSVFA